MDQILVGLDESDEARAALAFARRLADATDAEVVGLTAVEPTSAEVAPEDIAELKASARVDVAASLPKEVRRDIKTETVAGDVETALVERADDPAVRFVVIGTQPSEGIGPLGWGSHAHKLAHRLDCPLVVVPPDTDEKSRRDIVVGVDGSDANSVALDLAVDLSNSMGSRTFAVHVVDDMYTTFNSHGYFGAEESDARDEADDRQPVTFVERVGGTTEQRLADVVAEKSAIMLVVAARDRHSVGGLFLGDVPDHLLHQPPCPVMVLPHGFGAERDD